MRHGHVDYLGSGSAKREGGQDSAPEQSVRAPVQSGVRAVHLTEIGRAQAEAAGDALADVVLDRALCSGLPRTIQTAEAVLSRQRTGRVPDLEIDRAFEEIHIGSAPGVTSRRDLAAAFAFFFDSAAEPGASMGEGGEEFGTAYARVIEGLQRQLAIPGWSTMLLVAHEAVNRMMLSWAARAELRAVSAFEQDLACVNILDFDLVPAEGAGIEIARRIIKAVNLTPYNPTKFGMNMTSLEAIFARVPG